MRLTFVCSRPAVSTSTRSMPRATAAWIASNTTEPGSAPSCPRTTSTPSRSAHIAELVGGGGAERVGRGEEHRVTLVERLRRELGRGRGLADAVDADEQPDVGATGLEGESPSGGGRVEHIGDLALEQRGHRVAVVDALCDRAGLDAVDETRRGVESRVGEEQRLFQLVPDLVIEPPGTHPRTHPGEGRRAIASACSASPRRRSPRAGIPRPRTLAPLLTPANACGTSGRRAAVFGVARAAAEESRQGDQHGCEEEERQQDERLGRIHHARTTSLPVVARPAVVAG